MVRRIHAAPRSFRPGSRTSVAINGVESMMPLHRRPVRLLLILVGSLVASPALAGPPGEPGTGGVIDLPQALQLALRGHPRVAAQRASLAAAQDGVKALDALRALAALVTPELPARRRQACLGVTAAEAALDEAERETVYAVTRSYYAVVFTREQERVARGVVERLTTLRNAAQRQLDAGARDVSSADVARTAVYVRLAETRRIEATQGVKRAVAALREAVGLPPGTSVDVSDARLPVPGARPVLREVVAAALARRGSLIQVGVFAEVAELEVSAQGASHQRRLETFAIGSDVHGAVVPQTERGTEYRPGGIPPEMPAVLAGPRPERVRHAESLRARAGAVAEGTRNLVALEAEDAFLRWEQAALQAAEAKAAADEAEKSAEDLTKDFTGGAKVRVEDVTAARVLASQTRAQANEFLFRQIVALADLERITGGAFYAGLAGARAPAVAPAPPGATGRPAEPSR
jgi:outer membrane protein TolC